jgi:hypothetical protein
MKKESKIKENKKYLKKELIHKLIKKKVKEGNHNYKLMLFRMWRNPSVSN